MTFALWVYGDGLETPSVSSAQQASDFSLKKWQGHAAAPHRLVEFTVSPAAGSVRSMSQETIQVTEDRLYSEEYTRCFSFSYNLYKSTNTRDSPFKVCLQLYSFFFLRLSSEGCGRRPKVQTQQQKRR